MKNIFKLNSNDYNTNLEHAVASIINDHLDENNDYSLKDFIKDLGYGGCVSGMIGELIYYSDTKEFYINHQDEIEELIQDFMLEVGSEFVAKLHEGTYSNNAAWYAFEETSFRIASNLGVDY
jgi:hypothetical protein